MRNIMTASIGLAALVASGVVMADEPTAMGELVTSAGDLGVTADGRLVADDISISQMVADAASGTGHSGDGDHGGDGDGDSGDTGGEKGNCNCSTSANGGLGALALLLPVGLVATRRRR